MSLPIAILAGGLATRLRPATETIPKALIEIAGKPFAEHQIDIMRQNGVDRAVWLVGYRGDQLQAALGDGRRYGMRFDYVADGEVLLGTGGAIRRALPQLGEAFIVMYGDSYLECDIQDIEATFRSSELDGLMTVFRNDGLYDASNVEFADGRIVRYDKANRTPAMHHIDYGLGVLRATAFAGYPEGQAFDLAQVYRDLLARQQLVAVEVPSRFYEIGSPDGMADTERYLRSLAASEA